MFKSCFHVVNSVNIPMPTNKLKLLRPNNDLKFKKTPLHSGRLIALSFDFEIDWPKESKGKLWTFD